MMAKENKGNKKKIGSNNVLNMAKRKGEQNFVTCLGRC